MQNNSTYLETKMKQIHLIRFDWVRLPNPIEHNLMDWILTWFDLFDWVRLVQKSNSLKVWCSIGFNWVWFPNVRLTMLIGVLSIIHFYFSPISWYCVFVEAGGNMYKRRWVNREIHVVGENCNNKLIQFQDSRNKRLFFGLLKGYNHC